jgi:predicted aspartyl protease
LKIRLEDRLPFVTVTLGRGTREIVLDRVLLDTGSAATLFSVDEVAKLGIVPEPTDQVRRVVGVGGSEFVLTKRIERLSLGDIETREFPIQVGAMEYGFSIQGLLGVDFFVQASVVIDLGRLEISRTQSDS